MSRLQNKCAFLSSVFNTVPWTGKWEECARIIYTTTLGDRLPSLYKVGDTRSSEMQGLYRGTRQTVRNKEVSVLIKQVSVKWCSTVCTYVTALPTWSSNLLGPSLSYRISISMLFPDKQEISPTRWFTST